MLLHHVNIVRTATLFCLLIGNPQTNQSHESLIRFRLPSQLLQLGRIEGGPPDHRCRNFHVAAAMHIPAASSCRVSGLDRREYIVTAHQDYVMDIDTESIVKRTTLGAIMCN